jgi:hypothetical protein
VAQSTCLGWTVHDATQSSLGPAEVTLFRAITRTTQSLVQWRLSGGSLACKPSELNFKNFGGNVQIILRKTLHKQSSQRISAVKRQTDYGKVNIFLIAYLDSLSLVMC